MLASDLLQSMVNQAQFQNLHSLPIPLQYSNDFPILQYADDTLVIMEACPSQISTLKNILHDFSSSSGLKVNYAKSMMVPINVDEARTNMLAQLFGCVVGSLPFTRGVVSEDHEICRFLQLVRSSAADPEIETGVVFPKYFKAQSDIFLF